MKPDHNLLSYLAWFFGTVLALLFSAIALSLFFKPLEGDLTRIGHWAERDFAPTRSQSAVLIRANGSFDKTPRVLVLGDSFSHPNIWQSHLAESGGFETLSFQFKDVGCIDNWLNWVIEQKASSSPTVIIQVAERSFVPIFRNDRTCMRSTPLAETVTANTAKAKGLMSGLTLDAAYLFLTLANTLRMRWHNGRISSGEVINVPLSQSTLFSNSKSGRLLYYAEDDNKKMWSQKDIQMAMSNLKRIQNRLAEKNLHLLVALVPDKSTVYRPYMLAEADKTGYPDISSALVNAGINSADLLGLFHEKVAGNADLYLPNDTHLGGTGYRLMASAIHEQLKRADKITQ